MTIEHLQECPVCGHSAFTPWLTCKDYLVSGQEFQIQSCGQCGFKATNPRPSQAEIGRYYQSEQYVSHSNTKQGLINKLYHFVRTITLRQKVTLINQLQPRPGNLLDIGCGSGYFLATAQEAGWKINGTEPDIQARQQATERTRRPIAASIENLHPDQPIDVTTLWHVLEHIHSLRKTLEWIRRQTREGGHLLIAVPNYTSWDATYYKEFWAAYDVPRHLYHFSPDRIESLLNRYQFTIVDRRPMLFDAFYVNLLSTRNRDGKPAYVESFWNGLRSNWEAYRDGGNYSSLIYIARAN